MARPPTPTDTEPFPEIKTLPPVAVPAAAEEPAFSTMALSAVLVVLIASVILRSPDSVLMLIGPVALMPVGFTVAMVNPALLTKLRLPMF